LSASSSVAKSPRLPIFIFLIFFFCVAVSPRSSRRSSSNLPGRWQMGCFWFLKSFGGGKEVQKGHFFFGQNATWRQKRICLTKKRPAWSWWITFLPNPENRMKTWKGTAEIIWCIIPSTKSGTLLNRETLSWFRYNIGDVHYSVTKASEMIHIDSIQTAQRTKRRCVPWRKESELPVASG